MSLDDLEPIELDTLVELLLRSQQSRERKSLCINIGINYQQLNFLENTSEEDFFIRLVYYLKETGNKDALCTLCCKKLLPTFRNQQSRLFLKQIIEKIECNQSTTILNFIPIFPKKKIFLFISTFFLIVLTGIIFSNYKHPAITLQDRPAMADFNEKLYIAFKVNDASNQLYVTSSGDGTLSEKARPSNLIKTGGSPAMAVFQNKLYIAFRVHDPSNQLFVASSEDGTSYRSATPYRYIKIGGDPAMTVFQNKLYIASKANDVSNQLHVVS